jgi:propanol-preferring alcohol dehydrogenase
MKAAVLHKISEDLRIDNVPVPKAGPDEVIVRPEACGICGRERTSDESL